MDKKLSRKRLIIILLSLFLIFILFFFLIILCVLSKTPRSNVDFNQVTFQTGNPVPQAEIVYEIDDNIYGFINSNGYEYQEYIIDHEAWAEKLGLNKRIYIRELHWDQTGQFLVGYYYIPGAGPGTGDVGNNHPILIAEDGKIIGCEFDRSLSIGEQVWAIDKSRIVFKKSSKTNEPSVVLFDMDNCEIIDALYSVSQESEHGIFEIAYSSNGLLAITEFLNGIRVLDKQGNEVFFVEGGEDPAWSNDGKWLAFTRGHDLYAIDSEGLNESLVVSIGRDVFLMGQPAWSPDNQWIICVIGSSISGEELIKVKVQTGYKINLYLWGKNPSWR